MDDSSRFLSASRLIHRPFLLGLVWVLGGCLWLVSMMPFWESLPSPPDANPTVSSEAIKR